MSYISVDVDIDDLVSHMGRYDRIKFFESMKSDGYISESCVITNDGEVEAPSYIERKVLDEEQDEFNQALQKLLNNGWKLTKEQEEYIINLSKRF
jgi:hypothetical protein